MAYTPPITSAISTVNSSTATLGISGVFTGTGEDVTQYSSATVLVFANQASATDGLSIQQSSDNTNWDSIDAYTIPISTGKTFGVQITARYLRIVYTNGTTANTVFRLQTIYHYIAPPTSSIRPQDGRSNDNDMQESIGYTMLYDNATNTWVRSRSVGPTGTDSIAGAFIEQTGLTAAALNADLVPSTDVSAYKWFGIQITTVATGGTITFQGSNDNTNWYNILVVRPAVPTALPFSSTTAPDRYEGAIGFRFIRFRQTTYTSGSSTGVLELYTVPPTPMIIGANVSGSVTANLGTGGTAATSLGKAEDAPHTSGDVGVMNLGVRNDNAATATTSANGDYSQISTDINGTQFTRDAPSNTATVSTPITAATASTLVLAANPARRSAILYNNSTSDCYLKYGTAASSTSFTVYMPSLSTITINGAEYAGILHAIWITANGSMFITETSI